MDIDNDNSLISSKENNIYVVVGLDFGTTHSGFAYCHVEDQNISPALAKIPIHRTKKQNSDEDNKPVELFKLHLGNLLDNSKPNLPVDYKKAITDFFREIGKYIH
ncbi:hypothetical protein C1645_823307 [Glomus cerebriforme]|uniref:Uncharacterized protein n=1 Tax=Glomus cerebriforme TaxID=658196 RepID=A0A397T2J9_9GLOM|nr:hypothetical protein C1645_823307 [Glomus cerebriforme]